MIGGLARLIDSPSVCNLGIDVIRGFAVAISGRVEFWAKFLANAAHRFRGCHRILSLGSVRCRCWNCETGERTHGDTRSNLRMTMVD